MFTSNLEISNAAAHARAVERTCLLAAGEREVLDGKCRTPMTDTDRGQRHPTQVTVHEILTVPATGVRSAAAAAC